MKLFEMIVAVVSIIIAIYNFDLYNFNRMHRLDSALYERAF